MIGVLIKGDWDTDTHTGRTSCEDDGGDGKDASMSQGMPKITGGPPETNREGGDRFSILVLRRN